MNLKAMPTELEKIHKALVAVRELSAKFEELTGKAHSTGTATEIMACHLLGMSWCPTEGYDAVRSKRRDGENSERVQIKCRILNKAGGIERVGEAEIVPTMGYCYVGHLRPGVPGRVDP